MHSGYIEHVTASVASRSGEKEFLKSVEKYKREVDILLNLNMDPAIPILKWVQILSSRNLKNGTQMTQMNADLKEIVNIASRKSVFSP